MEIAYRRGGSEVCGLRMMRPQTFTYTRRKRIALILCLAGRERVGIWVCIEYIHLIVSQGAECRVLVLYNLRLVFRFAFARPSLHAKVQSHLFIHSFIHSFIPSFLPIFISMMPSL